MLAGIKLIPADQIIRKHDHDSDESDEEVVGSRKNEDKHYHRRGRKGDHKRHHDSSDDGHRKYSNKRKKGKGIRRHSSEDGGYSSSDHAVKSKSRSIRRESSATKSDIVLILSDNDGKHVKPERKGTNKDKLVKPDEDSLEAVQKDNELTRKERGLEWMLSVGKKSKIIDTKVEKDVEEHQFHEMPKSNPKELNPYLKDNGCGYPDDATSSLTNTDKLLPSSVVGDGGASWRLKALKRAKEQAARDGRMFEEVIEERWGSMAQLASSMAVRRAAPAHAHLHAIRGRQSGDKIENSENSDGTVRTGTKKFEHSDRDYLRNVSIGNYQMRKPKKDSLPWKKRKGDQNISAKDAALISSALSGLNKFTNDGSFMDEITRVQGIDAGLSNSSTRENIAENDLVQKESVSSKENTSSVSSLVTPQGMTANQAASKVLQLRLKGRHEEAEKLSKEMEATLGKVESGNKLTRKKTDGSVCRYAERKISNVQTKREEDADFHLAQQIIRNRQYSLHGRADDEYDFDDAPSTKRDRKKDGISEDKKKIPQRLLTQQERCQFCFENPSRPKHLVIAIANFTYLTLPHWQPVVQGHCCILPMQHDSATRTVDNTVSEEIRNFKKCLITMFEKKEMNVLFLETVVGLAQQRRHCLIECIPVPSDRYKEAPMYFKKAIDEAEEEWVQHEMKKLIQTSGNLRHVIPANFSYFHVEFGLDRGFVHIIDDDSNFKSDFGLNIVRGLLRLPEEDMYRRRRQEPIEKQKLAIATFAREWEPFDWTKQLE